MYAPDMLNLLNLELHGHIVWCRGNTTNAKTFRFAPVEPLVPVGHRGLEQCVGHPHFISHAYQCRVIRETQISNDSRTNRTGETLIPCDVSPRPGSLVELAIYLVVPGETGGVAGRLSTSLPTKAEVPKHSIMKHVKQGRAGRAPLP
eukprot:1341729-Pyramimonas_sp.AAC.1